MDLLKKARIVFLFTVPYLFLTVKTYAGIHTVPIVLKASSIAPAQYYNLALYRLFRSSKDGTAIPIPFQIDEKDKYSDYVLGSGPNPNLAFGNGVFDAEDELSFMGNDVGPVKVPRKWKAKKPSVLYEIKMKKGDIEGAVYIAVYFRNPPPPSSLEYVKFNLKQSEIVTSRYRYYFSPKNYLVVDGVDVTHQSYGKKQLIAGSTFFLRADLKWFLTFNINQYDIESDLDAYKAGPIRTIARVNFNYSFLKLKLSLGMYTEVSFFSNSVILPAIIDNPLDGKKTLNSGSQFYYGLALTDNPNLLKYESNMPSYKGKSIFDFLSKTKDRKFWLSAVSDTTMIYMEMTPSKQMFEAENIPKFYVENVDSKGLASRTDKAAPLGESRTNMAIYFDLTKFAEGYHEVKFRLFIESLKNLKILEEYKTIDQWIPHTRKIPAKEFK